MPVVTADEVVLLTGTSKTAGEIEKAGIIPLVQERINNITNNYFQTELYLQDDMEFDASARTITADTSFASEGFAAGDEIYVYHSYRNDGYYEVLSVAAETLTLVTGSSVVAELSGRSILVSVVQWPQALKLVAAQMVKYELDDRPARSADVTSRSLGPWSESYASQGNVENPFGYPSAIINQLSDYRMARLM